MRKRASRRSLTLRRKRSDIYEDNIAISDMGTEVLQNIEESGGHDNQALFQMGQVLREIQRAQTPYTYDTLKKQFDAQYDRPIVDEMMAAGYLQTVTPPIPEIPLENLQADPADIFPPESKKTEEQEATEPDSTEKRTGPRHVALTPEGVRKLEDLKFQQSAGPLGNMDSALLFLLSLVKDAEDSQVPLRSAKELDDRMATIPNAPGSEVIDIASGLGPDGVKLIRLFLDDEGQFDEFEGRPNIVEDKGEAIQHAMNVGPIREDRWNTLTDEEKQFLDQFREQTEEGEGKGKLGPAVFRIIYDMAYPSKDEPELWEEPERIMARTIIGKGVIPNADMENGAQFQQDLKKLTKTLE